MKLVSSAQLTGESQLLPDSITRQITETELKDSMQQFRKEPEQHFSTPVFGILVHICLSVKQYKNIAEILLIMYNPQVCNCE